MAPLDDALVNVTALRSSSRYVRLAALRALGDGDLGPFADELLPLLEDADAEVRCLAHELSKRTLPSRSSANWKLCEAGGMEPVESTFDFAQGSVSIACHPIYSPAWGVSRLTRRKARVVRENLLEEDLSCEPQQHWRVRDALAFTPKALRGDVLVKLLKDSDPHLRESALLALRRLVPIHWVHHVDMVSAMLIDRTPEVRIAALLVLFELDTRDLDLQVPRIVEALHDELWPVREAALHTLRKLRPQQLQRLSREVLRCKLDPSLQVRRAAQRILERLAPEVLADLACNEARWAWGKRF